MGQGAKGEVASGEVLDYLRCIAASGRTLWRRGQRAPASSGQVDHGEEATYLGR